MHFRQRRSLFFFSMPSLLQWCVQLFHSPTTVNIRNGGWCIVRRGGWGGGVSDSNWRGWCVHVHTGPVSLFSLSFFLLPLSFHPHPFTPLFILLFFLFIPPCVPLLFFSSLSNTHTQMLLNTHTHTLCSIPLACFYHRGLCPVIWSPLLDASSMMPLWINLRLHSSP